MNEANPAATAEPDPQPGRTRVLDRALRHWDSPYHLHQQIQSDLTARAEHGHTKYGTYLETHNGRDALLDAYQEVLDLLMYLEQDNLEQERTGYSTAMKRAFDCALLIRNALNRRETLEIKGSEPA